MTEDNQSHDMSFSGTHEVNGFLTLLNSAKALFRLHETHSSDTLLVSCKILLAFSFESYLNHVGSKLFNYWEHLEKLSWHKKVEIIYTHLGHSVDRGKRPFQTINLLFKYRDTVAHLKPVEPVNFEGIKGKSDEIKFLDEIPKTADDWRKISRDEIERCLVDLKELMNFIHTQAKLDPIDLLSESRASWTGTFL